MANDIDTHAFDAAVAKLQRVSTYTDAELVQSNARTLIRALAYNTPKRSGTGRAGWWPAWTALGMSGTPGTNRSVGTNLVGKTKRRYVAVGDIKEDKTPGAQSITLSNATFTVSKKGKRINYLYLNNRNKAWMEKAIAESVFKFEQQYDRLLARASR